MEPSKYQQAILNKVVDGDGNIVVSAVPGGGKTTTLVQIAERISQSQNNTGFGGGGSGWGDVGQSCLFAAFNKHIANELGKKLSHTPFDVRTVHSLGMRALGRNIFGSLNVDGRKLNKEMRSSLMDHAQAVGGAVGGDIENDIYNVAYNLGRAMDLLRLRRQIDDTEEVRATLASELPSPAMADVVLPVFFEMIELNRTQALEDGKVSFTDMIALPVEEGFDIETYDLILLDEVQDLSRAQVELLMRAKADDGRIVAVGDRHQAIYAFAGAGADSFDVVLDKLGAEEMPLSICYRCPTKIIHLANEVYDVIEPRDDAPEGAIEHKSSRSALFDATPDDLILCRNTAPLISAALAMIAEGIPARVRGRNIGKQISGMVRKALKTSHGYVSKSTELPSIPDFRAMSDEYMRRCEKVMGYDQYRRVEGLYLDQIEAACVIMGAQHPSTVAEFEREIDKLFADSGRVVWLSTIHRAKGLEADRVYLVNSGLIGSRAETHIEKVQEDNLRFVAYTRAKSCLTFVDFPMG